MNNRKISIIFFSWRIIILLTGFIAPFFLVLKPDFLGRRFADGSLLGFLWPWANFDGEHYLSIATIGYNQFQYAFFPLYPGLINIISKLLNDPLLVSLIISNLMLLLLLIVLNKLWSLDYSKEAVYKGILLFLAFPTAFYLGSSYTESIFLLLAVGSFWYARKGNYWIAGLLGFFACLTRLVGIFLIPSLLIMWWLENFKLKNLIPILFITLGFLLVLLFNYLQTGDPLYFFHVQPQFGANRSGGDLIFLPQVIFRYLKILFTVDPMTLTYYIALQEIILTSLAFVTIFVTRKKLGLSYIFFAGAVLLTPTLTGTLSSMPRYILAAFPLFVSSASMIKDQKIYWLIISILVIVQLFNVILFTRGYWVS